MLIQRLRDFLSKDPILFLVLAAPRSGTTHWMNAHFASDEILNFTEPFHTHRAFSITAEDMQRLKPAGADWEIEDHSTCPNFAAWRRENPVQLVAYLKEKAKSLGRKAIVLKLFPGHLDFADVATLIEDKRTVPIILHRNALNSFISNTKAHEVKSFIGVDTTNIRPALDLEQLQYWQQHLVDWYSSTLKLVKKKPCYAVWSYEKLFENGDQSALDITSKLLLSCGVKPLENTQPEIKQQDRAKNWQDKIANSDEVETFLKESNLLLDYSALLGDDRMIS